MVTKEGITVKRVEGYSNGSAVSFRSGDINLVVLRRYKKEDRKFLVSVFANAGYGRTGYLQFWINRAEAKAVIKSMKG